MIGYLQGTVLFSDGNEIILGTNSGIGYQIFYKKVLVEGSVASLFVSHIIRTGIIWIRFFAGKKVI